MATVLYRVSDAKLVPSSIDREKALQSTQDILILASIEKGLKDIWGQAAWNGYGIKEADGALSFKSGDEYLAKLWLAWQRRFEILLSQRSSIQAGASILSDDRSLPPPILERTAVGYEDQAGRKQGYIVGKARQGGMQAETLSSIEAT